MDKESFTLFIDNIPKERDLIWLSRTFNKLGVVTDAFIPKKTSKCTGCQFGFVRYGCHVLVAMAVSKMHGVWVDDKRLYVKEACFGERKELLKPKLPRFSEDRVLEPRQRINTITKRGNEEHTINGGGGPVWNGKFRGGSFAQVLRGEPSIPRPSKESVLVLNLMVLEVGGYCGVLWLS